MTLECRNHDLRGIVIAAGVIYSVAVSAQVRCSLADRVAAIARPDAGPLKIERGGANPVADIGSRLTDPTEIFSRILLACVEQHPSARVCGPLAIGPRRVMIDLHSEMTAAIWRSG